MGWMTSPFSTGACRVYARASCTPLVCNPVLGLGRGRGCLPVGGKNWWYALKSFPPTMTSYKRLCLCVLCRDLLLVLEGIDMCLKIKLWSVTRWSIWRCQICWLIVKHYSEALSGSHNKKQPVNQLLILYFGGHMSKTKKLFFCPLCLADILVYWCGSTSSNAMGEERLGEAPRPYWSSQDLNLLCPKKVCG